MTNKPKPGNQPDTDDMSDPFANELRSAGAGSSNPNLVDEEEEAAKLRDFA